MKHFLLLASILLTTTLAAAKDDGSKAPPQLTKRHEDLFTTVSDLRVDFNQTTFTSLRGKTKIRSGVAFFSKPGNFVWRFVDTGKTEEEYYFDGNLLSHFVSKENVVTHYGTKSGLQNELQAIVSLILDAKVLLKTYDATNVKEGKGLTTLDLKPKDPKATDIRNIHVTISDAKRYVEQVQIHYTNGNHTTFEFKNPQGSPIPPENFKFSNPGGVKENHVG